jgi:chromosome segregation ATPase
VNGTTVGEEVDDGDAGIKALKEAVLRNQSLLADRISQLEAIQELCTQAENEAIKSKLVMDSCDRDLSVLNAEIAHTERDIREMKAKCAEIADAIAASNRSRTQSEADKVSNGHSA